MALRWGIMSAGKISSDFVTASTTLDPKEHEFVGVAARSLQSAQDFAKKFGIPNAYGSYDELAKNPNIDVVYVGAINPAHIALVKLALENGKHVLCEKPLGINVRETQEMLNLAKQKKLFLMEAVWSRFFPAYAKLKEEIAKGTIGDVKQVVVTFGCKIAYKDRLKFKELGGGSMLDIGIYCTQFASLIMGGDKPIKIIGGGHMNEDGVDESTSTTLVYSGGRTATMVTNTLVDLPNEGLAVGTKGTLKLHAPFWCSTVLETPSGKQEFALPKPKEGFSFNFGNSVGLSFQCNEVRRCIKAGLTESPMMSHQETLLLAEIMESVRKQIGVVYPQDSNNTSIFVGQ